MLTDTKSGSMRIALHQIYVSIYVEYVVKNPLSPVEHPGGLGVNNELFEITLEQFVVRCTRPINLFCKRFPNATAHTSEGSSSKCSVLIRLLCDSEDLPPHSTKTGRLLEVPQIECSHFVAADWFSLGRLR
jgi:Sybindin-like family